VFHASCVGVWSRDWILAIRRPAYLAAYSATYAEGPRAATYGHRRCVQTERSLRFRPPPKKARPEIAGLEKHAMVSEQYARLLASQPKGTQVKFDDQSKRWNKLGTFVASAGAFHGLGPSAVGEWESDGAFMRGLLAETAGGGGETPYGTNDPGGHSGQDVKD
jgi:hypothetical protein